MNFTVMVTLMNSRHSSGLQRSGSRRHHPQSNRRVQSNRPRRRRQHTSSSSSVSPGYISESNIGQIIHVIDNNQDSMDESLEYSDETINIGNNSNSWSISYWLKSLFRKSNSVCVESVQQLPRAIVMIPPESVQIGSLICDEPNSPNSSNSPHIQQIIPDLLNHEPKAKAYPVYDNAPHIERSNSATTDFFDDSSDMLLPNAGAGSIQVPRLLNRYATL